MPKESDGSSLLSASDRAIYQYLDEMLSDSCEESGSATPAPSVPPLKPTLLEHAKSTSKQPAIAKQAPQQSPEKIQKTQVKPLKTKEKKGKRVLAGRDTLLGFEKPIVVQQPEVKESVKVTTKAEPKTEAKTVVESKVTASVPEIIKPALEITKPPKEIVEPKAKAPAAEVIITPQQTGDPVADLDPNAVIDSTLGDERLPPAKPWSDNGRPEWAQGRFECLLFKVAGLKLAVPLVTLGSIHQIERKFNALPGQFDWFIGILQTPTGNIKVLDTALCVMPERYEAKFREELQFVISLHGFGWGLACHELLKSITLEPEDVKWRSKRGKRPWLAGTVVDQMCALVDTAGFHNVIHEAENKNR